MPAPTLHDQKQAARELWPQIGEYCMRHGVMLPMLLSGKNGIPVDGPRLKQLISEAFLTADDLAAGAGVSRDLVYKFEQGRRDPSAAVFLALVRQLGCEPQDLLRDG
jgi:DNA-binding XRE family transcriptional regulator